MNKNKSSFAVLIFSVLMQLNAADQEKQLNSVEKFGIGFGAAVGEFFVSGGPTSYVKNQLQDKKTWQEIVKNVVKDPRVLWRGSVANAATLGLITGGQFVAKTKLDQVRKNINDKSLAGDMIAAGVAGASTAWLASPTERVKYWQQTLNQGLKLTVKQLADTDGARAALRGVPATAIRDGIWGAGLICMMPFAKEKIQSATGSSVMGTVGSAIVTGAVVGGASHSFDTIKTQQFAVRGKKGKTMFEIVNQTYQDGLSKYGTRKKATAYVAKELQRGFAPRTVRVILALAGMDTAKNLITAGYQNICNTVSSAS